MRTLVPIQTASEIIRTGRPLLVAGDEARLASLPHGNWIGGSIPYFMTSSGGVCVRDQVFIDDLDGAAASAAVTVYDHGTVGQVYADAPSDVVRYIIIPAGSGTLLAFALGAPTFRDFAKVPLIGWVSGVHLSELDSGSPVVFDGRDGTRLTDAAVVLETRRAGGATGNLQIVNPFTPTPDSPAITFAAAGFTADAVRIDGRSASLGTFLLERRHPTRLPLVGDYCGTGVNVSFQGIARDKVAFYAPVFPGVTYRLAADLPDYRRTLSMLLGGHWPGTCFNCILNYQHGGLEGSVIGTAAYPCTFGEIAYQLLNQTFVHLDPT